MTGNDIVDLATASAGSNWKRRGFLEKLFTPQEQQYIHTAALPEEMVWKLWSMKESTYKIYTRQYGGRFFAPLKFNCTIVDESNGTVNINNIVYQTTSFLTENYIYSTAKPVAVKDTCISNHCFRIPDLQQINQQEFIYKKLITCYTEMTQVEKTGLLIIKNEAAVPFLYCEKDKSTIPVSITHHGNYAGFTIN